MRRDVLVWVALIGIIVLAAGFRLYDIQNFPPGLFPDEAANGEDALLALDGDVRPFYPRGNGREGLYYYLLAGSIQLFGIGVWQVHLVSALIGTATVALVYFATRPWFGRLAGLLAALFLATNHWHVTMSRTGFRAILIGVMIAGFTACAGYVILAVRKKQVYKSYILAALAGAFFAGGFYTYIAYRVMVGVILGMFVFWLLASLHPRIGWPQVTRYWKQIVIGLLASLIVFAPLGWFFWQNPSSFIGRAGQVSVFNPNLQQPGGVVPTVLWSFRETLWAFFAGEGDLNWRHNVAGYPLLNPLVGLLFLLGLAWAIHGLVMVLYKIIRGQELHLGLVFPYLLLILTGMLAPVITTAEGIPHGLRSIGLAVPIFILAGTAGAVIVQWIRRRAGTFKSISIGVVLGVLVLGIGYDGLLYFVIARNDSGAHYAYRTDLTGTSQWLLDYAEANPTASRPYLVLDKFSVQTVHFLTSVDAHDYLEHPDEDEHVYRRLEPEDSHLTALEPGEVIVFTMSTFPDADRYETVHSGLELVESVRNRFGQEVRRVYRLPIEGTDEPEEEIPAGLDA